MTITRHRGWVEVSDIVGGYLVRYRYIGYTIKEAKKLFRQDLKQRGIL